MLTRILRNHRERPAEGCMEFELPPTACEARLLARHPAIDATIDDLTYALDLAPIYSTPGLRFRSTVTLEEIDQPFLWALDLESLKQAIATILLLPFDSRPSIPGMYQQMLGPMSDAVSSVVAGVSSMGDFTPELVDRLNRLIPHRRIEWIGTLRDLAHGDGPTARELRYRYFLETATIVEADAFADTPESVPAIPVAENEAFLDFLRGFPVRKPAPRA